MPETPRDDRVSRARYERERTARQRAEALLEQKSRALFEAERAKAQFLSVISHEFRTPLNGLLGAAEALGDELTGAGSPSEHLQTVRRSGRTILALVDQLLDLAALEARRVQLRSDSFGLREVLADLYDAARPRAEAKGLSLELVCEGDICRRRLLGDASRIRNILSALIDNAVKFTTAGSVVVTAGVLDDGTIEIAVDDTGPGVAVEDRDRIFEAFMQGREFRQRQYDGAGLGLNLAHDLAGLMGGTVSVEDSPLGGARFVMRVRLPEAGPEDEVDPSAVPSEVRRVLVVDDNAVNRLIARTAVTSAGMIAIEAENGREALDLLDRETVDVVLMDIQMPVMTGDEAIRQVRASGAAWQDVPIIVITAHGLADGARTFLSIGANKCLEKPVGLDVLRREIDQVLRAAPLNDPPSPHPEAVDAPGASESSDAFGSAAAQAR